MTVGQLIKERVRDKGWTLKEFAVRSHLGLERVRKMHKQQHFNTDVLLRVSEVLEHNFFEEYSNYAKHLIENKALSLNGQSDPSKQQTELVPPFCGRKCKYYQFYDKIANLVALFKRR